MFRSVNKSKCIVAAGLVVLLVAVFLGYWHMDRAYVEPPDAYGTPISVEAFSKGYDAILEELSAPPEASAPTPVVELIRFSTDATGSAFLKGDQTLEMSATDGATRIYYTTDGSDPRTSDSIRRYIEPLKLKASRGAPAVYHIAAAAFYGSSNSWHELLHWCLGAVLLGGVLGYGGPVMVTVVPAELKERDIALLYFLLVTSYELCSL